MTTADFLGYAALPVRACGVCGQDTPHIRAGEWLRCMVCGAEQQP